MNQADHSAMPTIQNSKSNIQIIHFNNIESVEKILINKSRLIIDTFLDNNWSHLKFC